MQHGICLVTGGAGFIGCALSPQLVRHFGRVVVIDALIPQVHPDRARPAGLHPGVELIEKDIALSETWNEVFGAIRPDVVIHLAAETGTAQSQCEVTLHARANVLGTAAMLEAMTKHNAIPEKLIVASSRAVYGEGRWWSHDRGQVVYPPARSRAQLSRGEWAFAGLEAMPSDAATTIPKPASVYGVTKLTQEQIISAWALGHDASITFLRLQNVYGPGQSLTNPYTGLCSIFSNVAASGGTIRLFEDGNIVRDFIFIEDVANAFMLAIAKSSGHAVYDVGSGSGTTIARLASLIASYHGAPNPIVTGEFRVGDVRHAECDIRQVCQDLGWRPEVDLTQGASLLAGWISGSSRDR